MVNWVSSCVYYFLNASTVATYILITPTYTTTIIIFESCALNVKFKHFTLRFNKNFLTLWIPLKKGIWAERKGEDMDISIVCPKFNISLVKYNVLQASFKKVKIWVTVWLWPKHKLLCSLYFSFVMHGWCDQT